MASFISHGVFSWYLQGQKLQTLRQKVWRLDLPATYLCFYISFLYLSLSLYIFQGRIFSWNSFHPSKKKQKNMQNYNRLIFYNKYLFNTKQQDLFCSTLIDTSAMNLPDGLLEINLFCIVPFYSIFNICGKTTKKKLP